jgi:hypothetical protein
MRRSIRLVVGLMLPLSACLNNQTIDEEIAGKCGISVAEYQRAEASLGADVDGKSINAGQCRLTRTSKGTTEGTIIDDS